jgi:hypothetical protein
MPFSAMDKNSFYEAVFPKWPELTPLFMEADLFLGDGSTFVSLVRERPVLWISCFAGKLFPAMFTIKKWALDNGYHVLGWKMKEDHPLCGSITKWRAAKRGTANETGADFWVDLHTR